MRDGYDRFATTHGPALLRLAYVLTGDAHRAEDLTQTALINTHRRWRQVRSRPEAYARKALVNAHIDWHRRRSSTEVPTEARQREQSAEAEPDHADAVASRDHVRTLLARLAPRARTVLVMRYYADMSDDSIAESLEISPSTVRATASRALTSLRTAAVTELREDS